jgi:hypothetical protein
MKLTRPWFLWAALMALGPLAATEVDAQPVVRDHGDGKPADSPGPANARRRPPPDADAGPREAPPAPQPETVNSRPGFVFAPGHWDWREGKWVWVAGHWERERAGKEWHPGRWDQQNGRWVFIDGAWADAGSAPPAPQPPDRPGRRGPREAPPAPRAESAQTRAGFVWVQGAWDWQNDKWEWVAGHFEREQANREWHPVRWQQRGDEWVREGGEWSPRGETPPTPTPGPGRPRRDWKLDKPVVSSFWPIKGKAGTRVTIRGRNFPNDAAVLFGDAPVTGAKITADTITFLVPANAATGTIAVRAGGRRAIAVGGFEVAASYDAAAEAKRIDDERRRAAEAAWAAQQAKSAKDRAARVATIRQREEEQERTREQRRQDRIAELQKRWERAFLADSETQAELTLHAQRAAELVRMHDIAEIKNDGKLAVRIEIAQANENDRHAQRMTALEAAFRQGGTP